MKSVSLVLLCLAGLLSCINDGGFVSPGNPDNLPVLARFHGRAITRGSTLPSERSLEITNPKIALVWQFVGPSSFGFAFDRYSVEANSPYKFSAILKNPPPDGIAYSEEPVIGSFWFYTDANGNDTLDRLTHPRIQDNDAELKFMQEGYQQGLKSLLEVSVVSKDWVAYMDTFLLDSIGTFIRVVGGRPDTLLRSRGIRDKDVWNEVLFRRLRLLKNFNGWQNFFALRAKTHEFYRTLTPTASHSYLQIFEDWRKLFPKPGMEEEFEQRLKTASLYYLAYYASLKRVTSEAEDSGWVDYPYQGFKDGLDWVIGKSRRNFVLYFPNQASRQRVLDAESWGSFRVDNIDKLHLGYNLLHCDDQYRCKVMGERDSIYVDLADNEAYFNPPSSKVQWPVERFDSVADNPENPKSLTGGYAYRPNRPITVTLWKDELWCEVPDMGAFRMMPGGPRTFYVPGRNLQFEFVAGAGGAITKLFMYFHQGRAVAIRADSLADEESLKSKIAGIKARFPTLLSGNLPATLPTRFAYGKDSLSATDSVLSARYSARGDSIFLSYLGLPPIPFLPLNDSQAYCPVSEDRLAFERNGEGRIAGMRLTRPTGGLFLPDLAYKPRKPGDFSSDTGSTPAQPASASGGSGRDTYVNLGARKRFACAEDKLYLKPGDGWVERVHRGETGDSISFGGAEGNGLVFKVTGQAGLRIRLDVVACGERGGKQGGILMEMRGGGSENGPFPDLLAESDWVRPNDKGDTISYSSIKIPSDPYFLKLKQVRTHGDSLYYSFDGYRAWSD